MDDQFKVMRENAGRATDFLASMANPSRLMILCLLSQREMTVGELGSALSISQSALSQHLAILRREDIVQTRREAQFIWYSLKGEEAQRIIAILYDAFCAPTADRPRP